MFNIDCEHLIRHMLVVDPERRLSLEQISRHRWLSLAPSTGDDVSTDMAEQIAYFREMERHQLDGVVVSHMLKLPQLTFDEIADSVHQQKFNHIFAIYHLLLDKISLHQNEEQRLQQYTRYGFSYLINKILERNLLILLKYLNYIQTSIYCK